MPAPRDRPDVHWLELPSDLLASLAHTNGGRIPAHFKLSYGTSSSEHGRRADGEAFRTAYLATIGKGNLSSPMAPSHLFHGTSGSYPGGWQSLRPRDVRSGFWAVAPGAKFFASQGNKSIAEVDRGEALGPVVYGGKGAQRRYVTVWEPGPQFFSPDRVAQHFRPISSQNGTFEYQGHPIDCVFSKTAVTLANGKTVTFSQAQIPKSNLTRLGVLGLMACDPNRLAALLDRAGICSGEADVAKRIAAAGLCDVCEEIVPHVRDDDLLALRRAAFAVDLEFKRTHTPCALPFRVVGVGQQEEQRAEEDGVTYTLHGNGAHDPDVGNLALVAIFELPPLVAR
jgi:hypothetical protein